MQQTDQLLNNCPVIAILRGITPRRVLHVAAILIDNGISVIEVPLNSPQALESIEKLSNQFGGDCLCGAGTVITPQQAEQVGRAGGRLIVSPNTNPEVIETSLALDMVSIPGFQTASEAFSAIAAGACWLKFFPAASIGMRYLQDVLTVLPHHVKVIATGGINPHNLGPWLQCGARGAGIGSTLYRPDSTDAEIEQCARQLIDTYQSVHEHKTHPQP